MDTRIESLRVSKPVKVGRVGAAIAGLTAIAILVAALARGEQPTRTFEGREQTKGTSATVVTGTGPGLVWVARYAAYAGSPVTGTGPGLARIASVGELGAYTGVAGLMTAARESFSVQPAIRYGLFTAARESFSVQPAFVGLMTAAREGVGELRAPTWIDSLLMTAQREG